LRLEGRHAEIDKLDLHCTPVEQNVLWFEVPVMDMYAVTVLECGDDLAKEIHNLSLLEPSLLIDVFEKFAAFHVLHDKVAMCVNE